MTKEQEEVIAAARDSASRWSNPPSCYTDAVNNIVRAVRALEESEKPKPKVWTKTEDARFVGCSDGRELQVVYKGYPNHSLSDLVVRALNLLEQTEGKPCFEYRCNKCLREAGPCCTCKST